MKKTVSLILALILVCSISVSAFAAGTKTKSTYSAIGDITFGEAFDQINGLFPKDPFDGFLDDFTKALGFTDSLGTTVGNLVKGWFGK